MNKELLLQISALDLEAAKGFVEESTDVSLRAHESMYRGGEYFLGMANDVELVLQENFMEDDGALTEADFPHASILMYVDGEASLVDEIVARMGSFSTVLRSIIY